MKRFDKDINIIIYPNILLKIIIQIIKIGMCHTNFNMSEPSSSSQRSWWQLQVVYFFGQLS